MFATGFQSFAFQSAGSQKVIPTPSAVPTRPDYYHYSSAHSKYREEEYQRQLIAEQRAELRRIDEELAEAERQRLEAIAESKAKLKAKKAAKKLAAFEAA